MINGIACFAYFNKIWGIPLPYGRTGIRSALSPQTFLSGGFVLPSVGRLSATPARRSNITWKADFAPARSIGRTSAWCAIDARYGSS
jgi:hypothetical protein